MIPQQRIPRANRGLDATKLCAATKHTSGIRNASTTAQFSTTKCLNDRL